MVVVVVAIVVVERKRQRDRTRKKKICSVRLHNTFSTVHIREATITP